MNEDKLMKQFIAELEGQVAPFQIAFRSGTLVQLAGLLQLAMRHPHVPESNRKFVDDLMVSVRDYFKDCPATLDILDRGDNPDFDISSS